MDIRMMAALLALPVVGIASPAAAQDDATKDAMVCLALIKANLTDIAATDASNAPELAAALGGPRMTNTLQGLQMFYMGRLSGLHAGLDASTLSTFSISYQTDIEAALAASATHRANKAETAVEPQLAACLTAFEQSSQSLGGGK